MRTWRGRGGGFGLLLTLLGGIAGCSDWIAPERQVPLPEVRPEPIYEALFPYYVELCAVSQYRSKAHGTGGVPGHAVMYLKGACKDEQAPWPRLRACRRVTTSASDREHGAGVSVNRWFRNVNWVAIPGRELFFEGVMDPGGGVSEQSLEATLRRAIEGDVYRGVSLHGDPGSGEELDLEEFVARHSLGTDFALRFSRTVFCARLPLTQEMLGEVVDFLNDLNREYATGAAEYAWSGYHDNCVHTLRNALAAASVWAPKSVNLIKLRQLFHLAIPANEFATLAELGADGPLEEFEAVFRDDVARDSLLEFGWLPRRHGALLKVLPVHARNDLFDTTYRQFVLEGPWRRTTTARVRQLLLDPRNSELGANLSYFSELYARLLAREVRRDPAATRGDRRRLVRRRYQSYLEAQRDDAMEKLARWRSHLASPE